MTATKKVGGLAGVTAGETALCTVGQEGAGLTYRGYDIYDLADNAGFEEVAYLLLYGHLPNRVELDTYIERLKTLLRPLRESPEYSATLTASRAPSTFFRSSVNG